MIALENENLVRISFALFILMLVFFTEMVQQVYKSDESVQVSYAFVPAAWAKY
jgi:hypothetical protein